MMAIETSIRRLPTEEPLRLRRPSPDGAGGHPCTDTIIVWRWDQADPVGLHQPNENPSGIGAFTYNPRFQGSFTTRKQITTTTISEIMIRKPAGTFNPIRSG